jgi:hypothetical protein
MDPMEHWRKYEKSLRHLHQMAWMNYEWFSENFSPHLGHTSNGHHMVWIASDWLKNVKKKIKSWETLHKNFAGIICGWASKRFLLLFKHDI